MKGPNELLNLELKINFEFWLNPYPDSPSYIKELQLEIGFIEEMRTTWDKEEVF